MDSIFDHNYFSLILVGNANSFLHSMQSRLLDYYNWQLDRKSVV